jgi:hypothetical protein
MRAVSFIGIACLSVWLSACSISAPSAGVNSDAANQTSNDRFDPVKLRRIPRSGPPSGSGSPAPLDFRPGPENSEIATTMNDRGQPVEVRVFKDHPQLQRVEAVWLGPTEKLLRITLRDGNTVEVKTDSIANLASASADVLVQLATGSK